MFAITTDRRARGLEGGAKSSHGGRPHLYLDRQSSGTLLLGSAVGGVATRTLHGEAPVAQLTGGQAQTMIIDHLGSLRGTVDPSEVLTRYDFDAFGVPLGQGPGRGQLGYAGGTQLANGGTRLGQRIYLPDLGRFATADPASVRETPSTSSLYAYAANSPVVNVDPLGLFACPSVGSGTRSFVRVGQQDAAWVGLDGQLIDIAGTGTDLYNDWVRHNVNRSLHRATTGSTAKLSFLDRKGGPKAPGVGATAVSFGFNVYEQYAECDGMDGGDWADASAKTGFNSAGCVPRRCGRRSRRPGRRGCGLCCRERPSRLGV